MFLTLHNLFLDHNVIENIYCNSFVIESFLKFIKSKISKITIHLNDNISALIKKYHIKIKYPSENW